MARVRRSQANASPQDPHAFHGVPEPPLEFSDMPHEGSPKTPGRVRPDISFVRHFFNDKMTLPDGKRVEYWGFHDGSGRKSFPAPLIRVREGQIVHTNLVGVGKGAHTIHHHGIQPSDFNDGVGHTSFEVNGHYTYQWRPSEAGSYFYHCHVNTTLHFEMGMYGPLIVDPPDGPGTAFRGGPAYDVEAMWICGGLDPAKHELNHAAGLKGEDVRLNLWNPKYFHISGAFHPRSLTNTGVAVIARAGQTILARITNGGYFPQRFTFGGLEAEVIASDGRPFPDGRSFRTRSLLMGSAERYDLLLRPTVPGRHVIKTEHLHWITGEVVGFAETTVTVEDAEVSARPPADGQAGTEAPGLVLAPGSPSSAGASSSPEPGAGQDSGALSSSGSSGSSGSGSGRPVFRKLAQRHWR